MRSLVSQCCGRVRSSYDVIQKLKKTLNNTQHHNIIANQQHQQTLRARGVGVLPYMGYMGMCAVKGMVFKLFTLAVGYINQSVWV